MTLETDVSNLTQATTELLKAVNVQKSYMDAAAKAAIAGVTVQGAILPTAGKSPVGNAKGVFDSAWLDPLTPLTTASPITVATTNTTGIIEQLVLVTSSGGSGVAGTAIRFGFPGSAGIGYGSRIVGAGDPTVRSPGYTAFEVGAGGGTYREIARFTESGVLLIGTKVPIGNLQAAERFQVAGQMRVTTPANAGSYVMSAGRADLNSSFLLYAGDGSQFPQPASVLYLSKDPNTSRSISANGYVSTSGSDYAEYVVKSAPCKTVAKGQIVGITASNTLTDLWADAVMFCIKSTDPSFVGSDTWSSQVGARPLPRAGTPPTPPPNGIEWVTGAHWAEVQAKYEAELDAYNMALQQDAEALRSFEIALEEERQKVDRIAIAGRVPVNVLGTQPGDYIVPIQDGESIQGIAVHEDDITLQQYLRAVGKVIGIEPDGRAYVMVKVA